MSDVGLDAAKWRAIDSALREKVRDYETWRMKWVSSQTSGEYAHTEAMMNEVARDIAGYLALAMPEVRP